jgi:transposase
VTSRRENILPSGSLSRKRDKPHSFVDLDPTHPGGLLGLAPGRSGASVRGWLDLQSQQFRNGIEVVAVDPSPPFAAALREVLPSATLVVDHWHLHRLANLMLTQVRQRVTQQVHGHRGRKTNDSWAYRRLLLRGARHLSDKQWRRLRALFTTDDPTGEIQAAWAGQELLRQLLDALPASSGPLVVDPRRDPPAPASRRTAAGLRPYEVRARLGRFYDLAAQADVPELERLASTVETWWPAIEAYLPAVLRKAHHAEQRRDRGVMITVRSRPSPSTAMSQLTDMKVGLVKWQARSTPHPSAGGSVR